MQTFAPILTSTILSIQAFSPIQLLLPMERRHGYFTWMPGLSYQKTGGAPSAEYQKGFSNILRGLITYPVHAAKITPPVTVDRSMIETPILLSDKGAAVTVLNWTGEGPQKQVVLTIKLPFTVKTVESAKRAKVDFQQTEEGLRCTLPLNAVDILIIKP